jgi:hypothetical protein
VTNVESHEIFDDAAQAAIVEQPSRDSRPTGLQAFEGSGYTRVIVGRSERPERAQRDPCQRQLVREGVAVAALHEPGVGVPEQRRNGVGAHARRELMRCIGVSEVVHARPRPLDPCRPARAGEREPGEPLASDRAAVASTNASVRRPPPCVAVGAEPVGVLLDERHGAATAPRLRRDDGVPAVRSAVPVEAAAYADEARLEVEPAGSPDKRQRLADP